MDKISIMGVRIDNKSMGEVLNIVQEKLLKGEQYVIYTPNTEIVMMCQNNDDFMRLMNKSDINIPDGIGLIYASKIKGHPLKEKVAGFDLSMNLLQMADKRGLRLFAIGGKPGIAEAAMSKIHENYPGIKICGSHHGYFKGAHLGQGGHDEELKVVEEINRSEPDILFVGFGAKKQEQWIEFNKNKINAKIIIGNGGTLDGIAGIVKRAPEIYIKLGLEWLYRLIQEPKRISRQIVLPIFMVKIITGNKNIIKEIK